MPPGRGRTIGAKNRFLPSKRGPVWDLFVEWFSSQEMMNNTARAAAWRGFHTAWTIFNEALTMQETDQNKEG